MLQWPSSERINLMVSGCSYIGLVAGLVWRSDGLTYYPSIHKMLLDLNQDPTDSSTVTMDTAT